MKFVIDANLPPRLCGWLKSRRHDAQPPQVVRVAVGNCSNARLFEILAIEWDEIERALSSGSRLISITQNKLEVFA